MLKKITFFIFVFIVAIVFFAQYDPWVREKAVTHMCAYLEQGNLCTATAVAQSINFFSPELIIDSMLVASSGNAEWQWKARRVSLSFSWWSLIKYGRIDVQMRVYGCQVESQLIDEELAIMPHVQQFFVSSVFPIATTIKLIEFNESALHVVDKKRGARLTCSFSSTSKEIDTLFKTMVHIVGGDCTLQNRKIISFLSGTVNITMAGFLSEYSGVVPVKGNVEACIELPQLDKPTCFVAGSWENGNGRFSVRHVAQALTVDPFIISTSAQGTHVDFVARCPLSYVWRCCADDKDGTMGALQGNCLLRVRGEAGSLGELKGHLVVEDVVCNDYKLCSAFTVTMHKINQLLQGHVKAHMQDIEVGGTWHIGCDTGEGALALQNSSRFTVPGLSYWYMNAGDFMSNFSRSSDGAYLFSYASTIHSSVQGEPFVSRGEISGEMRSRNKNMNFLLQGMVNGNTYKGNGSLTNAPYVDTFTGNGQNGDSLFTLKGVPHNAAWSGLVSYALVNSLLNAAVGHTVQGKGAVAFDILCKNGQVQLGLHLKEGTVRLPYMYNFINSFDAHLLWDVKMRSLFIDTFKCGLHTGTVRCSNGLLCYGSDRALVSVHVPIVFNRCLFNIHKNMFAVLSGDCVVSKQAGTSALLNGQIGIDRAHIKDLFFSYDKLPDFYAQSSSGKSFYRDFKVDLGVKTTGFIHVDTSLLQAQATANVNVAGTVANPTLEGDIVIDSGSLIFPYKPLHITKGRIKFEPDNSFNPLIELRARSTIKKHIVNLYAQGLLHDHQVILDSNPPLTEEQIVSLLLVGSSEDSLNVMMPALIMHNLKRALWGLGSLSFLDNYFKRTSIPFSINLVPSFTDQTGRGGLRGGIEIMVNDRWRALIQKNFSLSEDTRFELEYFFSDDVGVRLVRDEHRDIGGEMEMRWKF